MNSTSALPEPSLAEDSSVSNRPGVPEGIRQEAIRQVLQGEAARVDNAPSTQTLHAMSGTSAERNVPSTQAPPQALPSATRNAVRWLAEWQGCVTKIEGDHFYADMHGVLGSAVAGKRHDGVIPRSEVSPEDLSLLREGAYFRLSVMYTITRGGRGTSKRESSLVFRRLPAYRKSDIEHAEELGKQLIRGLRLE